MSIPNKWDEVIKKSGGRSIILPDKFKKAADEMEVKRREVNEGLVKCAERELKFNKLVQDLFLELRIYYAQNGLPDVWVKDMGFNADALKEGVFILNMFDKNN